MPSILNAAAQRVNASVAGLTGQASIPSQEPGAPHPASVTEVADLIPSEFGGLTHLFGSQAPPNTQQAPVQVARDVPAGSLPGKLGGLVPDARNAAVHSVATAKKAAATGAPALSATVKANWIKARQFLKI